MHDVKTNNLQQQQQTTNKQKTHHTCSGVINVINRFVKFKFFLSIFKVRHFIFLMIYLFNHNHDILFSSAASPLLFDMF